VRRLRLANVEEQALQAITAEFDESASNNDERCQDVLDDSNLAPPPDVISGDSSESDEVDSADSSKSEVDSDSSDRESDEDGSDVSQVFTERVQNEEFVELNEDEQDDYILNSLREWAKRGVSMNKIDDLLKRLRVVHRNLPLSYKTLLGTPKKVLVREMGHGEYWHTGIATNIRERISEETAAKLGVIKIDINIDGMNLRKSDGGKACMWPILGCFPEVSSEVFLPW